MMGEWRGPGVILFQEGAGTKSEHLTPRTGNLRKQSRYLKTLQDVEFTPAHDLQFSVRRESPKGAFAGAIRISPGEVQSSLPVDESGKSCSPSVQFIFRQRREGAAHDHLIREAAWTRVSAAL